MPEKNKKTVKKAIVFTAEDVQRAFEKGKLKGRDELKAELRDLLDIPGYPEHLD